MTRHYLQHLRQSTGWYFLLVAGWMLIMGLPTFGAKPAAPPIVQTGSNF